MNIKTTIVEHQQGSEAWLQHRASSFNASELAAAMGVSPYMTRTELIAQKATGLAPEVDAAKQRIFDNGHRYEAIARPWAEDIIGEELFPVVLAAEVDGMRLSASLDGQTMAGDITWEHKSLNGNLRQSLDAGVIPSEYHPQMEQGLMLSGASRCLFMASNGDRDSMRFAWYESQPALRAKIIPIWKQVQADAANYAPSVVEAAKPTGKAPDTLPALRIEVTGMVTASNLAEFKEVAIAAIRGVNRNLASDADFADAEQSVKWCEEVETRLKAAKEHALSQTASIDKLFKTIDDISAEARKVRLALDKLVKGRKDEIKAELVAGGVASLRAFVAELNESMPGAYMPAVPVDFGNAIKGLRTVESIRNAVDSELARAKIEAFSISRQIHQNLGAIAAAKAPHLFADVAALVIKNTDDVLNVISVRTNQEAERIRAAAERIRAEEVARVERVEREAALRAAAAAERERERIRLAEVERVEQAAAVVEPADSPMPVVEPAQQVQAEQPRRMSLWSINLRLSPLVVNYKTLESLGFHATYATSRGTHADYLASDFSKICQAISDHALAAATKKATP